MYNCSTTLCKCKLGYEGNLCEKCNWHEFYFASHGIDGIIDEINGYGVTCKKGILEFLKVEEGLKCLY